VNQGARNSVGGDLFLKLSFQFSRVNWVVGKAAHALRHAQTVGTASSAGMILFISLLMTRV
jgi:hypothetical protein